MSRSSILLANKSTTGICYHRCTVALLCNLTTFTTYIATISNFYQTSKIILRMVSRLKDELAKFQISLMQQNAAQRTIDPSLPENAVGSHKI